MDPAANEVTPKGEALIKFVPSAMTRPFWLRLISVPGILILFPFSNLAMLINQRYMKENVVKTGVSNTAFQVARTRFICHCLGLINDPFAWYLLPWRQRLPALFMYCQFLLFGKIVIPAGHHLRPDMMTMVAGRTLFYDSVVENSGMKQYVILGAGFDCRAHRVNLATDCKIFEVDAPLTQANKKSLADYSSAKFLKRSRITYVSCDFSQDNFLERLQANGFDMNIPTVFTLEGVTRYLTWEQLSDTLTKVTKCAKGSLLAMNISIDIQSKPEKREKYKKYQSNIQWVAQLGEPVKFGMDEDVDTPARKFLPLGFSSVEVWLGPREIKRRYFPNNPFLEANENSEIHLVVLKV